MKLPSLPLLEGNRRLHLDMLKLLVGIACVEAINNRRSEREFHSGMAR